MAEPVYLTPAEVAVELHVKSVRTVRRNLGHLYVYASPRTPLIRRDDLDAWLDAARKPKPRKRAA